MALSDEIRQQTVKMKDMTGKERMSYIWEYYKWWIIAAVAAIIVICSLVRTVLTNNRPTYLNVVFLNSLIGFSQNDSTVEEDFIKALNIDTDEYNIAFDYSMMLDGDRIDQNTYTSQIRLAALLAAKELDIFCAPESAITSTGALGSYADLEKTLPAGMLDKLKEKGYEPFYYTEVIDDGFYDDVEEGALQKAPETVTYIGGIYIDNCEYLNSQGAYGVYDKDPEDRAVLTIAPNTQNLEHAVEFINFITE